jgi:hypothetical protein
MVLRTFLTRIVFLFESLITGSSNPTTLRNLYPTFVSAASLCCFTAEICPIGWFVSSTGGSGQQRQCVECPYGSTNNATDSTACNGDNAVVYACALLAVTTGLPISYTPTLLCLTGCTRSVLCNVSFTAVMKQFASSILACWLMLSAASAA